MTDDQVNELKEEMHKIIGNMSDEELQADLDKYLNDQGIETESREVKKDCKSCNLNNVCTYTTDVIPKSHKDYWCKETHKLYAKLLSSKTEDSTAEHGLHDLLGAETSFEADRPMVRTNSKKGI